MSQVGTIKGYHDGSTYSLADIYDEKTFDVEIGALKVGDSVTGCKTQRTVWFDLDANPTTGIMFADENFPTRKPTLHTNSTTTVSPLPYITTENTAFGGYGLRLDNSHFFHTETSTSSGVYAYKKVGTVAYYMPVHTFECWLYVDTSAAESDTFYFFTYGFQYKLDGHATGGDYRTLKYTPDAVTLSNGATLSRSILDKPFHFAEVLGYGETQRCYINGELVFQGTTAPTATYTSYSTYWHCIGARTTYLGSGTSQYKVTNYKFTGVISEYRCSIGARYHENFTPQSFKPKVIPATANMLIRHNGANCYIPMTTDKSNTSTPCLAVRHGKTNYYAIK